MFISQTHEYQCSINSITHIFLYHIMHYGSDKNKTMTYDIGNLGPGLEQAHKCGSVKPVNEYVMIFVSNLKNEVQI
jgi:hypothetical protein